MYLSIAVMIQHDIAWFTSTWYVVLRARRARNEISKQNNLWMKNRFPKFDFQSIKSIIVSLYFHIKLLSPYQGWQSLDMMLLLSMRISPVYNMVVLVFVFVLALVAIIILCLPLSVYHQRILGCIITLIHYYNVYYNIVTMCIIRSSWWITKHNTISFIMPLVTKLIIIG